MPRLPTQPSARQSFAVRAEKSEYRLARSSTQSKMWMARIDVGRMNAEQQEESRHNQRIHRRHDRRGLIGNKRAAEPVAGHQGAGHIALLPGMDVVRIHQVFKQKTVEWNHSQAKRQRHQEDEGKERARGAFAGFLMLGFYWVTIFDYLNLDASIAQVDYPRWVGINKEIIRVYHMLTSATRGQST